MTGIKDLKYQPYYIKILIIVFLSKATFLHHR